MPGTKPFLEFQDNQSDPTRWEAWWKHHRELYLTIRQKRKQQDSSQGSRSTSYSTAERSQAMAALVAALDDRDRSVRLAAVVALGKVGGPDQSRQVERRMTADPAWQVRHAATLARGLLKDPSAGPRLVKLLLDPRGEGHQRSFAAVALGFLGDPKYVPQIETVIRRRDNIGVQLCACLSLSMLHHERSVRLLGQVLANPRNNRMMRTLAAYGLGRQPGKSALDQLVRPLGLRRDQPMVLRAVALALGQRSERSATAILRRMISRVEDIPTKGFAYLSLARLRQPDQTPFLIDALKRARYLLRPFVALALGIQGDAAGRSTLRKYIHRYRNDDSYYSAGAIALGLLKDKQFVGGAIARLRDRKDPGYKPYWMSALGLAADRSAVPVLIEQFKQRPKSWEVRYAGTVSLLALGNSEPLKILPGDLASSDRPVRVLSALALGETASRTVIGDLCRALKDGEKQVRLNATISLGRLLDKTSPHGSLRQLVFGYNYQLTPLNHYLGHIFGLIWPGAGRGSSTQSNSPAAGGSGVGGIAGGGVTR